MTHPGSIGAAPAPRLFTKDALVKGQPAQIECLEIAGQTYQVTRGPVTMVALEEEWYEDVRDPAAVVDALASLEAVRADLFTFWQRAPDLQPRFPYYREEEEIALLPIQSYEHWWNHQIKSRVRSLIRKAQKDGVEARETSFDDEFVRGMTAIFNEAPVRQGRPFWHYGKDADTVKRQFSRYLHRERMIGAYYQNEMIGFVMLGDAGRLGVTGQIISSLQHRDKAPNNVLIAKAVEVCERHGLEYLAYLFWTDDSLSEFKRRCGFERTAAPRYYVPLSRRGAIALKLGVHRGMSHLLPGSLRTRLKALRASWYAAAER